MSFEACQNVQVLMKEFEKPWFIAGGWAIDLFKGEVTRAHGDLEIAIFREHQLDVKAYLKEWTFKKVSKGTLHQWGNEYLQLPIHETHATHINNGEQLEILLNEVEHNEWVFRRDRRITKPVQSVWRYSETGIPYLNPEIVLLYKAKNAREKDHKDFHEIYQLLTVEQKTWLVAALALHEPKHVWIPYLTESFK